MKRQDAVTNKVTDKVTNEVTDKVKTKSIKETSDSLIATMKELDRLQKLTITFTLVNISLIFWVLLLV